MDCNVSLLSYSIPGPILVYNIDLFSNEMRRGLSFTQQSTFILIGKIILNIYYLGEY